MDKKKILKLLIFFSIIVLILVAVLLWFYTTDPTTISKRNLEYINSDEWNSETYPEGMPKFFRAYKGNLTAKNMGKSISYVTNKVIPNYNITLKNLSEEEIKTYFEENKNIIALDLGIESEKEFIEFVNEIEKVDVQDFEIESFYIDGDTIEGKGNTVKGDLYITYKGAEEISLKIIVSGNEKKDKSAIKYCK